MNGTLAWVQGTGMSMRPAMSMMVTTDSRPVVWVVFCLAQNLAGDQGDFAFAEDEVAQQVDDGVAFGPVEVGVGQLAGGVADV
jgi:hypothetical protein